MMLHHFADLLVPLVIVGLGWWLRDRWRERRQPFKGVVIRFPRRPVILPKKGAA